MADFEMTFAATAMGWIKKEVITISDTMDTVIAHSGIQYQPHMTVGEALKQNDVDGIIIPGGWDRDLKNELMTLIQKLDNEGKLLSAICAGPEFLAKSGILEAVKYTTTLSKEGLSKNNEEDPFNWNLYVKQNVVRDKNVVTATGNAFVDFALELIDYFNEFNDSDQKEAYIKLYKGL